MTELLQQPTQQAAGQQSATQPQGQAPEQGTPAVQTVQQPTQTPPPFKSFATEEEFNNASAKIRGSVEREILNTLGLKPEDKDKLAKFKEAYDNSLTEEQRKEEALQQLSSLKSEISEKDAIIVALTKLSGKDPVEVSKLVKMAKGLVGDDCTIEQALDDVMKFVNKPEPQAPQGQPQGLGQGQVPNVVSKPLNNPSPLPVQNENNPFKNENLTAQGLLIRQDPTKARDLARQAGWTEQQITF